MKLFCLYNGILKPEKLETLPKELFRKSIHWCTAFIPLLLKHFYWPIEVLLLLAVTGYTLSEILRLKGINVPLVSLITRTAARKRDEGKFVLGPVTLVLGIVIASLIFESEYYTIGILSLAFGDGIASISGKMLGRIKIPFIYGKTVAGSLSCFFAIFICSFLISKNTASSIIIATSGMVLEMLPLKDFDNLLIPIVLSLVAKILCY